MIFDIFMYILGTLIVLNGFILSNKRGTLDSRMTQIQMLSVVGNHRSRTGSPCAEGR